MTGCRGDGGEFDAVCSDHWWETAPAHTGIGSPLRRAFPRRRGSIEGFVRDADIGHHAAKFYVNEGST